MIRGLCPILALISLSCGGSSAQQVTLPPVPAPETKATLVGPRCSGTTACSCRDLTQPAAEEAKPAAGSKRFELRVGPAQNELWVTVDDQILYKSKERAEDCFYIDLQPGKHAVQVHGKNDNGVGLGVQIYELSGAGKWWYHSFDFDCSSGGVCDMDSMRREQQRIKGTPRGIHAPCGSVRVQSVEWRTGTMPDSLHPGEIVLDFVLNVYKFQTEHQPGSSECK